MKHELFYNTHRDCQVCQKVTEKGFKHIKTQKGEKYTFEVTDSYTLVFILFGESIISCNEFVNVHFHEGEIVVWPMNSSCSWESLTDTAAIVLLGDNEMLPCDKSALEKHAELWLNTIPIFKGMAIKPRMMDFLVSVKNYLEDGITCPYMHKSKQQELSTVFRAYYSSQELMEFFLPAVCNTHEFKHFIMSNYLQMKGVKEFVNLSGMKLSTFNRKFKAHFQESPYQWIIKQKSKHIYHELSSTNKSLASIAKSYHFADASHFNRYCKAMFGAAPSKIREEAMHNKIE